MKGIRGYWHLLAGVLLGVGLGLVISWGFLPQTTTEATPSMLQDDFKDNYRSLIALAYASTGDLPRAENRLASLEDANMAQAIESQAQRSLAGGDSPESLEALAILAAELSKETSTPEITATSTHFSTQTPKVSTPTGIQPIATATEVFEDDDEPVTTITPIPVYTRTPASITEASPTARAPYILKTQDEICSINLSEALLMVFVSDASQRAMSGVDIIIAWDGNEEHFFTGLKPELGSGYADFLMEPNQEYSLRLALGSTAASNLSAPSCEDDEGNHYWGSLRLKFEQP